MNTEDAALDRKSCGVAIDLVTEPVGARVEHDGGNDVCGVPIVVPDCKSVGGGEQVSWGTVWTGCVVEAKDHLGIGRINDVIAD